MNPVIIGLGSMGRRRARLLSEIDDSMRIVGVDLSKERREQAEKAHIASAYPSLVEALSENGLDAAFVCTSPASHSGVIRECLEKGLHVFSELNLVSDGYDSNIALAEKSGLTLFLSSTFLYRKEVRCISKKAGGNGAYTYHVGQYLPDWHPWESYKNFFVSDARTSGVRELLAIELPWLVHVFGDVVSTHVQSKKSSGLEVPYDDVVQVLLEHESGAVGTLSVDIVSRRAVRRFEYFDETAYLTWDGTPDTLREYDFDSQALRVVDPYAGDNVEQLESYASFVVENAYRDEIAAFIDAIAGKKPLYDFPADKKILRIVDAIEGSR